VVPETDDADELASEYERVFGFNVFPYASVFLEENAMLGGSVSAEWSRLHARHLYQAHSQGEEVDHVGTQLAFVAWLLHRDVDQARQTMGAYVSPWLPPFVCALHRIDVVWFSTLADLTLDLSLEIAAPSTGPARHSTEVEGLLEGEQTGVREIVGFLSIPVRSGLFLSRHDITVLGRAVTIPRGFGGRAVMLSNLLRTAAAYDRLPDILDGLSTLVQRDVARLNEIGGRGEVATSIVRPWLSRLRDTGSLVSRIASETQMFGE
jgi:hypothetical protein